MPETTDGAAPLEPLASAGTFVAHVIDFAGYKLEVGRRKAGTGPKCEHHKLIYCADERRVWCSACDQPIDSFDALVIFARGLQEIVRAAKRDRRDAWEAKNAVIARRAAKDLDREWGRKMAPCCPHCRRGLLPHDFADGAALAVGQDIEIARRKKAIADATPQP